MAKLIRDKRTGDYYTEDMKFKITKGTIGWNVNGLNEFFTEHYKTNYYEYSFSCDTLKEVRESL